MAHPKRSGRRRVAPPRRYTRDPHRSGLARSFVAWAARQGLAVQVLSEEQRIVLEAVRRFLAWSGPGTLFTRLAFLLLLCQRSPYTEPPGSGILSHQGHPY